ncbi:P-type ATPase [Colletotrichum truncatum]|uniref:P-type ATPase n=1 Tax=Colletotrichum truncatum TaxID=5467 RepID=A0ACC3YQ76_COLTU|nr:P-type ATPase [Colletotrichum truncatum]KAF6796736.1 P-type ATPase [Colletotrichum truncatum]
MDFQRLWSNFSSFLRRSPLPPSPNGRHIPIRLGGHELLRDERRGRPYISNAIKTSKYNVFDFLPRQLLYQFSRLANFYMLVISILQMIPGFSTTGKFTTIIPLIIFLSILIVKEGYYDWKRHRQDVKENNRLATALRSAAPEVARSLTPEAQHDAASYQWTQTTWKDLKVGDIVLLARDDDLPADVVLLHADGQDGLAYVDTMALDGETSLKAKQRPANLSNCGTIEQIAFCNTELQTEDPNADLYRFDGKLTTMGNTIPLTVNEVIYRGSTIRNTSQIIAIVINTGEECKIRKNANRDTKPKQPALEGLTNLIVLFLMTYVLVSSAIPAIAYTFWKNSEERFAWYLSGVSIPFADIFVGFIIMFNNVIPLSLYVGLEGIKLGQMHLISNDLEMYHRETDTPADVNTTNNLDDLGQVSYVFSDKTGTLTENIMNLRKLSVAGISLSHLQEDISGDIADATDMTTPTSSVTTRKMLDYIRMRPDSLLAAKVTRYILAIALCHTCLPEKTEDGELDFQASSPDELALVRGARDLGFRVTQRSSQSITVQMPYADGSSYSTVFEVLDVIEFSSKRKRMTIILRCPDGKLWLICKGADSIILPRLKRAPADMKGSPGGSQRPASVTNMPSRWNSRRSKQADIFVETREMVDHPLSPENGNFGIPLRPQSTYGGQMGDVQRDGSSQFGFLDESAISDEAKNIRKCFVHIDDYAKEGLRTLVYAEKYLDQQDYQSWKQLYRDAETSLDNRQNLIEEVSELVEQSFDLLGASAVEDKLQKGVPETIEKLRQARVKIWMLTGDKRETAINIAHSTRLISASTSLFVLDVDNGNLEHQLNSITDEIQYGLSTYSSATHRTDTAIVIDGETLTAMDNLSTEPFRRLFMSLVTKVDSVICCRASPAQKALLVTAIRKSPRQKKSGFLSWLKPGTKNITLAIGDGANDLAMISAANVGVGISGREGQQAARLADFSISQFRYLSRLMLVHGRWNYYRTTRFILVTFWKETFLYFPQALFQAHTGATGTSLYEPGSLVFASFFTGACIFVIGAWEQDLKPRTLTLVPELFQYGQNAEGLNMAVYLSWFFNALIAATIIYAGAWGGYAEAEGVEDGLYAQAMLTFIVCVVWINIKILVIEMHYKTKVVFYAALGSVAGVWVFAIIIGVVSSSVSGPYSIRYGLLQGFGTDASWWSTFLMVLGALTLMELTFKAFLQNHALRAWLSRCWSSNDRLERKGGGVREGFCDWETRLWQEMEKDARVQAALAELSNAQST